MLRNGPESNMEDAMPENWASSLGIYRQSLQNMLPLNGNIQVYTGMLLEDLREIHVMPQLRTSWEVDQRTKFRSAVERYGFENMSKAAAFVYGSAAYGIRAVELLTNQTVDMRHLPRWIGEFTEEPPIPSDY